TISGLICSAVAPVNHVAWSATRYSGMFGSSRPTNRPLRAPMSASDFASRWAWALRSANVVVSPYNEHAARSGQRFAASSTSADSGTCGYGTVEGTSHGKASRQWSSQGVGAGRWLVEMVGGFMVDRPPLAGPTTGARSAFEGR